MDIEQLAASASRVCANEFSNYLVGGNLCNAFALGEVGSASDFFLVGAPPEPGIGYPIITGHLLDSAGKPLVRIVRNALLENPGGCTRKSDPLRPGFEIADASGKTVLKVQTSLAGVGMVTTLEGEFFNQRGEIAASLAEGGLSSGKSPVRVAMGLTPTGFGMGMNLNPEALEAARWCLGSGGTIHRLQRGEISGQDLNLDGSLFIDATIRQCRLTGATLDFAFSGKINLADCQLHFDGKAAQIFRLAQLIMSQSPPITQLPGAS